MKEEEIQRLADLAHIAVSADELKTIAGEMDAILGYVSDVTKLSGDTDVAQKHTLRNVMRPDEVTNEVGEYTESIAKQFPDRDGDALRVKKIL
jgi:aspartyl-tRNA(Asn)/glutamyl-tRNA(Gln) amidotransferase subunit C